jgi:hypothetical protein
MQKGRPDGRPFCVRHSQNWVRRRRDLLAPRKCGIAGSVRGLHALFQRLRPSIVDAEFESVGTLGGEADCFVAVGREAPRPQTVRLPAAHGLAQLLARVEVRRLHSRAERAAAYALRYRAYLREGAILEGCDRRFADTFDDAPNALLIGAFEDGALLGSIRLHMLASAGDASPALEAFPEVLGPLRAEGRTILDPNRFVVDREAARRLPELSYLLLRIAFLAAGHFNVDLATATVRREHMAFYRRVLRYHSVCKPRPYPTLTTPLGLMVVNHKVERAAVLARYPLFQEREREVETLFAGQGHINPVALGVPTSQGPTRRHDT